MASISPLAWRSRLTLTEEEVPEKARVPERAPRSDPGTTKNRTGSGAFSDDLNTDRRLEEMPEMAHLPIAQSFMGLPSPPDTPGNVDRQNMVRLPQQVPKQNAKRGHLGVQHSQSNPSPRRESPHQRTRANYNPQQQQLGQALMNPNVSSSYQEIIFTDEQMEAFCDKRTLSEVTNITIRMKLQEVIHAMRAGKHAHSIPDFRSRLSMLNRLTNLRSLNIGLDGSVLYEDMPERKYLERCFQYLMESVFIRLTWLRSLTITCFRRHKQPLVMKCEGKVSRYSWNVLYDQSAHSRQVMAYEAKNVASPDTNPEGSTSTEPVSQESSSQELVVYGPPSAASNEPTTEEVPLTWSIEVSDDGNRYQLPVLQFDSTGFVADDRATLETNLRECPVFGRWRVKPK